MDVAECTCFELPPEMWTTHYGAVEPGSTHEPNPDCPEHFRKPPFRLADGTWSDGVDRRLRLVDRGAPGRWEVWQDSWGCWIAWLNTGGDFVAYDFDTHAEAIAYADNLARTTKNGENK